jgi:predicted metalloprotease with PDZ domain
MPRPHRHLYDVAFSAEGPLPDTVAVRMPVWTPGSYLVREYARNVQDLEVTAPGGRRLDAVKTAKNVWTVEGAADGFEFRFKLYANELSVQSSHLDDTHGFIHPPSACPYVESIPQALDACLLKALAKSKVDRWKSAVDLGRAIGEIGD